MTQIQRVLLPLLESGHDIVIAKRDERCGLELRDQAVGEIVSLRPDDERKVPRNGLFLSLICRLAVTCVEFKKVKGRRSRRLDPWTDTRHRCRGIWRCSLIEDWQADMYLYDILRSCCFA